MNRMLDFTEHSGKPRIHTRSVGYRPSEIAMRHIVYQVQVVMAPRLLSSISRFKTEAHPRQYCLVEPPVEQQNHEWSRTSEHYSLTGRIGPRKLIESVPGNDISRVVPA